VAVVKAERDVATAAPEVTFPQMDLARVDALVEEALAPSSVQVKPVDRRTRNALRTKQAILKAAWRLFLTVGYEQTTIQDITEAADIGKGTFFSHFSKKSDVALYLCTRRADIVLDLYQQGQFSEGPLGERIERMLVTFARLNCDPDPEARLMTDIVLRQFFAEPAIMQPETPAIEGALAEVLGSGTAAGELPPETDCEAVAGLLHAAFYSAKAMWLRPGPYAVPFDLVARVRTDVHVILRGIGA
jgi:AcrR family transcriptional regulator